MLFDILIQIAVLQQNADATRMLIELRQMACDAWYSGMVCQVFFVG